MEDGRILSLFSDDELMTFTIEVQGFKVGKSSSLGKEYLEN